MKQYFITLLILIFGLTQSVCSDPALADAPGAPPVWAKTPNQAALPLSFVAAPNPQPAGAQMESRTPYGTLRFATTGVSLTTPQTERPAVGWQFIGANPHAELAGSAPLPGVLNTYRGSDPAQWRTGLPTFAQVTYRNLYPGISLMYDGSQGLLKGTFTVAPGRDPGQIRWHYPQATQLHINAASGDLHIALPNQTTLTERAPVAWQEIGGRQVPVAVRFHIDAAAQTVGFTVGEHNPAYPLIIDPTLEYSTFLGGNNDDIATDVAVDAAGNVYLTGYTYSTSFPGGGSGNAGYNDLFITKINAAGTAILYTTIIGGNGTDEPGGIVVSPSGSQVWVTGQTTSGNFPTQQPFQAVYGGSVDAVFIRLNSSGGLTFSSYLGGDRFDAGQDVALDSHGDVHFTGAIWGGFFGKIDGQTGDLLYYRMISGQEAAGNGIAVDAQDNIFITGEIRSDSWPTVNPVQAACGRFDQWTCSTDAFVVKLNPAGDNLLFSTYLGGSAANGGSGTDTGRAIAVDGNGNIAITGETFAGDFPLVNAAQAHKQGANNFSDAFVARLTPQGSGYQLGFSTYLGGTYSEYAYGLVTTAAGQVFVSGLTNSENLPVVAPLQAQIGPGVCITAGGVDRYCNDAFIAQFSPDGALVFSTYWGGTADDSGGGAAIDAGGHLYVTGRTASSNFPTTPNALDTSKGPYKKAFLIKLAGGQAPPPPPPTGQFKVYVPVVIRGK